MRTVYVVRINMRDGSKRFVAVRDGSYTGTFKCIVVKKGSDATRSRAQAPAELVNEYFYEHCWDRDLYETREVVEIRIRGPRPEPARAPGRPREIDDRRVAALRARGRSLGEIARELGVTRSAVQGALRRLNPRR